MSAPGLQHRTELRVRYSETDQMGTFYNSRVLEWFEVARTECLRAAGLPYAEMEHRGASLPLIEAGLKFQGRARYDDRLQIDTRVTLAGRASVRFEHTITQADNGAAVASGFTLHAITDPTGRPIRPPAWLSALFSSSAQ
ncbi:acyl-CoA thioesterase [Opitutus terrae]|uniref:Thioesterase superfamily protein n=1 Tax=Opitutus terrae (strain DSM 11246 / JCM 15787 / PB90-1) TaxID=452637 RepID=B1ZPA0_OPITP|nr:thioesterase family protein [Opitutus terrae]ACB77589.1 thioesterase superfamily protein [Opitutus terrae PB90-1]